jgi:hypothetical protein
MMVFTRLRGFEPPTLGSGGRCSDPLSYRRKKKSGDGLKVLGHRALPITYNPSPITYLYKYTIFKTKR